MVEPVEAAVDASFPDDFLLLDFPSVLGPNPNHNPHQKEEAEQKETLKNSKLTSAAAAGKQQNPSLLFQDILDNTVDSLPGLTVAGAGGGGEEEEEELEWLSNKEAFPALETSFDIPTHSRSSSSSGGSSATAAAAERVSPVSVLAAPVPRHPRSKGGRKRRRVLLGISSEQPRAAEGKRGEKRKCCHCQAEETPQWRAGPDGPKTLCNACGVRYKSGRLVPEYRPASSPTFSATLHSNSHRRILEMRRRTTIRGRKSTRTAPPPLLADHSAL